MLNSKAFAKHGQTTARGHNGWRRVKGLTFRQLGPRPDMRTTRRKSKAAAAAAAQETATRENSPVAGPSTFAVTIPEDVDFDALSSLLPDVNLANPAPEAIVTIYRLLLGQAADSDATQRELEEARAEMQRKEVELDQALQDHETSSSELESTIETLQKELGSVKQDKETLGTSWRRAVRLFLTMRSQPPSGPSCKNVWTHSQIRRLLHPRRPTR